MSSQKIVHRFRLGLLVLTTAAAIGFIVSPKSTVYASGFSCLDDCGCDGGRVPCCIADPPGVMCFMADDLGG